MEKKEILQDRAYLQLYWDLSNEDQEKRIKAAAALVSYHYTFLSGDDTTEFEKYRKYTFDRLVKGLSSSRDAARQGFALALSEVLNMSGFTVDEVFNRIETHNKVSGSLALAEERDLTFGKLFGYASFIHSDLFEQATNNQLLSLLKRIFQIYDFKSWIHEVTVEVITLFFSRIKSNHDVLQESLALLHEKLNNKEQGKDASSTDENHLMLIFGLQCHLSDDETALVMAKEKLANIWSDTGDLEPRIDILLNSAKKFPKVHQVWEFIISDILELTQDESRDDALPVEKKDSLMKLTALFAKYFFPYSKEKQSLALKLSLRILKSIQPVDYHAVLTTTFLKTVLICRAKQDNQLYGYVGAIMQELLEYITLDGTRCKEVLSLISSYIDVEAFDRQLGMKFTSALFQCLQKDDLVSLVKDTCQHMAGLSFEKAEDKMEVVGANVDTFEANKKTFERYLQFLAMIIKYCSGNNMFDVAELSLSVLLRLSFFTNGQLKATTTSTATKKDKKSTKKTTNKSTNKSTLSYVSDTEQGDILELSNALESIARQEFCSELATPIFLSRYTDMRNRISTIDKTTTNQHAVSSINRVLQFEMKIFEVLFWFYRSNFTLSLQESSSTGDDDESEDDNVSEVKDALNNIYMVFTTIWKQNTATNDNVLKKDKIIEASTSLVLTLIFRLLIVNSGISAETVVEVSSVLQTIILSNPQEKGKVIKSNDNDDEEDDDEEDDEDDNQDALLFDACVDLLSTSNESFLKDIRDGIKRVWHQLIPFIGDQNVSQSVVNSLVDLISNLKKDEEDEEDAEDEENSNDDDDSAEDMQDEEAEDDDDEEDEEKAIIDAKKPTNKANNKPDLLKKGKKEDIMVSEDNMMDFLMEDNDLDHLQLDTDSEVDEEDAKEGALLHRAEADDALVKMIKLRQEQRKAGIVAMQKKGILLRTRIMDILEIFINRINSGPLLFSLLRPLLLGYKQLVNAKLILENDEGKQLLKRYQTILENELCKKKFHLKIDDLDQLSTEEKEETQQEILEEVGDLLTSIKSCLLHKVASIRTMANHYLFAVARIILHGEVVEAKEAFRVLVIDDLLPHLLTVRRSPLTVHIFEELFINRFMDFFLTDQKTSVWNKIVDNFADYKSEYTSAELFEFLVKVSKRPITAYPNESIAKTIYQSLPTILTNGIKLIKAIIESTKNDESNSNNKANNKSVAKRVKSISATLKSYIANSLTHVVSNKSNSELVTAALIKSITSACKDAIKQLAAIQNTSDTMSAQVTAIVDAANALLTKVKSTTANDTATNEKESKKRKNVEVTSTTSADNKKKQKETKNTASKVKEEVLPVASNNDNQVGHKDKKKKTKKE